MTVGKMKRTPFHDFHVANKAKLVPFAGFEMPVQYPTGITKEHQIVRESVGVFDVSHMGEFEVTGPDRNAFVNRLTCNDVSALAEGQAQYSAFLTEDGTFIDDCLVYRFDDRIMLVVNASNIKADWEHIVAKKQGINVRLKDISDDMLHGEGTMAKLLSSDEVYQQLMSALDDLGEATGAIARGEGTIGKLVQDDEVYNKIKQLLQDVQGMVDAYREQSPVISAAGSLFGAF